MAADVERYPVGEAPAPAYVYDGTGRGACILCAMHVGIEEGELAEQVPDRTAQFGFAPDSPELRSS